MSGPVSQPPYDPQATQQLGPVPRPGRQQGFRQRPPTGPQRPRRSKALDYGLKALGLVLVAVVSGVLWWVFQGTGPSGPDRPPGTDATSSPYQFTPYHQAVTVSNCADLATMSVKQYLAQHPCQQLSRSLYTTQLPNGGGQVLVGLAVVRMSSAADAKGLDNISKGDNTGHVVDLVEDGTVTVPGGPPKGKGLENGGYASAASTSTEVIAVTEFLSNAQDTPSNLAASQSNLKAVAEAAVKQLGGAK